MNRGRHEGFTYVGVLILVALLGFALAGAGQAWRHQAQREREAELLFAGAQIRSAIVSYLANSPGSAEYPPTLEALLEDRRLPAVRRHLRRIYVDPMTGRPDWVPILSGGRITGVHSRSAGVPFRRTGFDPDSSDFADAATYRDWRFVAQGGAAAGQPAAGAAGVPAPGATPVAPELPADDPGIAVRPRPPGSNSRCDDQRLTDLERCAALRATGSSAELTRCYASTGSRLVACNRGGPVPPLQLPPAR